MSTNLMKYNPAFLGDEGLIRSFVARTSELEHILEVLRENTTGANQHLLVIGPRGIGKTTLVLRTAAEVRADPTLGAQWYPVVYGEETYQVSSAGEFWLEALFHVGQQTEDARWQQAYEELLGERNEERLRPRALAQLMDFADQQGKRLLLVVENLNMLFGGQIGDADAWVLRHTLMNEPRIMLLGTATSRFREMDEYNQALYELFRIIELEPLADQEAQAVWTAATGQSVPRHQLRPIQILTGGNPRLIRILSEFAAKTSFRSLMDDLTRLVDEHTEYFKHHLDNLPAQERKVFVVLADLWDPSTARQVAEAARLDVNVASAQLKRLMDRGAVTTPYKQGRTQFYQVAERMYNIYHLMRRRGQASSRVHAVVRFMVSLYRDEELIRTTRSLAEEAARLTADQRREHFVAYEAILMHTREPRLAMRLVELTRPTFETIPDVPASLLRLIGNTIQIAGSSHPDAEHRVNADLGVARVDDVPTLLKLAAYLESQPDREDEAEAAYRKVLQRDPNHTEAWSKLGQLLLVNDRHAEAVECFDHALALNAENATSWADRGFALAELGRAAEALASYDRALALDSDDEMAWTNRGFVLGELGRVEEALESYQRALVLDPESALAWMNRGVTLGQLGRTQEELECLDRALSLDTEDATAWDNRGIALGKLDRVEEALESFDNALRLDPENAVVWASHGTALGELGRTEEALASLDRALALDAENPTVWTARAIALHDLGRGDEALESLTRAIALDPNDGRMWTLRATVLFQLGREAEALESCDRALVLNAEDSTTWHARALALGKLGHAEEALDSFERALVLHAENLTAWTDRGVLLFDIGRADEAIECFDRALALTAGMTSGAEAVEMVGALNEMAWAVFEHGLNERLADAETWAYRAVEQAPGDGRIRHTLACILGALGRWNEALDQAAIFLRDHEMLDSALDDVLDLFIDAAASGHADEVAKVIRTAGAEDALEPLLVALRRLSGEQVDIAREILEISTDVIERIETRRRELQEADQSE